MGIIDDLLANPGTYIGIDRDPGGRGEAAARIVVTPLPGGNGVSLDYETFSATNPPDRIRGHAEHALLGRETQPGVFELGDEPSGFPMAIRIEVPEPGRLRHVWSYGAPGEEIVERDIAELTLIPGH
jgi:hypothetical protein